MTFQTPTITARPSASDRKALPHHAREHNRGLLVRTLYEGGPQSRADLARATGLAKVTVSDLVQDLLQAGFVRELGTRPTRGPGKPGVVLDLALDAFLVAALDLSEHDRVRGALVTMDATVVEEVIVERENAVGENALELVYSTLEDLIERADRPVFGVGIGTPGLIDDDGVITYAPNLGWTEIPLRSLVEERLGVPTVVMNDANLALLGEHLYGEGRDDLLLVKFGHGLGAGLMLGGNLIRGSRQAVGEIGHLISPNDTKPGQPYSADNVLERWLAVPELRRHLEDAPDSEKDAILRQAGRRLGEALAPIAAMLDLSEVVLYGPEDLLAGSLPEEAMEVVRECTLPQASQDLRIRLCGHDKQLVLLGCAAQVVTTFLGIARGTQLSNETQ